MSIHTIGGNQSHIPGFFTQENINTISYLITTTIAQTYHYSKKVVVPNSDIVRTMQDIHEERAESVAKMNQRVVHKLVDEFLNFTAEQERANYWAQNRWNAYNRDPSLGIRPYELPKLRGNRVRKNDEKPLTYHFTY